MFLILPSILTAAAGRRSRPEPSRTRAYLARITVLCQLAPRSDDLDLISRPCVTMACPSRSFGAWDVRHEVAALPPCRQACGQPGELDHNESCGSNFPSCGLNASLLHSRTNTQTHKHTNTQTHKHTDTQTHKHKKSQAQKNYMPAGTCKLNAMSFEALVRCHFISARQHTSDMTASRQRRK